MRYASPSVWLHDFVRERARHGAMAHNPIEGMAQWHGMACVQVSVR